MTLFEGITLPSTPQADAVRKFVQAQYDKDFSRASEFFSEDIFINGILFQIGGREKSAGAYQDFTSTLIQKIRLEAVNEVGSADRYMVLHWVTLTGATEEMAVCDLVTLTNGLISRIDNCFNVDRMPQVIKDDVAAKRAAALAAAQ